MRSSGRYARITLFALFVLVVVTALSLSGCGSVADPGTPLEGPVWVADTYQGPDGSETPVLPNSYIDIVFDEDIASGNSGVNQYSGQYTTEGENISIGPFALTRMSGPEELMSQETTYLAALEKAETFEIADRRLILYDAAGDVAATFTEGERPAIAGTWQVTGYNESEEAFRSVVIDTTLTAEFGEDGTLSGSAGCNDYTASYTTESTDLTIEGLEATKRTCDAPEGIMEQEAAFLDALKRSVTYEVLGAELTLYDEEGMQMVTAVRMWE